MNHHDASIELQVMRPRMPYADIDTLIAPVTTAWNSHRDDGVHAAATAVIAEATWPAAYRAGYARGQQHVIEYMFAVDADRWTYDTDERKLVRAVADAAQDERDARRASTDPGPSRAEYAAALGALNGRTDAECAAIAARIGWTHGYIIGNADGSWSAAVGIAGRITHNLCNAFVRDLTVNGQPGNEWLGRLEADAQLASEHAAIPVPSPDQAFPGLDAVRPDATRSSDAARATRREQAPDHRDPGRRR